MDSATQALVQLAALDADGLAIEGPHRDRFTQQALVLFANDFLVALKLSETDLARKHVPINAKIETIASGVKSALWAIFMISGGWNLGVPLGPTIITMTILGQLAVSETLHYVNRRESSVQPRYSFGLISGMMFLRKRRKAFEELKGARQKAFLRGLEPMQALIPQLEAGRDFLALIEDSTKKVCPKLLLEKNP